MACLSQTTRCALWALAFGSAALWMSIVCAKWASDDTWVLTLMSTTVVVAWCAAATEMLLRPVTAALEQRPDGAKRCPTLRLRVGVQLKRALAYQVPPRRFWLWLTGGMSGLDLCVGATILGLDALWLVSAFLRFSGFMGGDLADARTPGPHHGALGGHHGVDNIKLVKYAGLSFAWAIIPQLVTIMYPVPRSCFLHWMFGTEMPHLIKYHRWLGHIMLWNVSLHGLLFYVTWWWKGTWVEQALEWNNAPGINNLAGTLATVCGVAVWVTSTHWVRRHYYQVFYNTHCLGIALFMLFSFAHYPSLAVYSVAGWFVYLLDLALRLVQRVCNTSTAVCTVDQQAQVLTIHLTFQQGVTVLPTQYVYLKCPASHVYQRHPFSIASIRRDPDTQLVSAAVHVKALGPWTQLLLEVGGGQMPVVVEGPYGSVPARWRTAEVVVLIAGGIGVTPILSILEDLLKARAGGASPAPPHVYLIWVSRHAAEFQLLPPDVLTTADSDSWLTVQLCDTGKEAASAPVQCWSTPSADIPAAARPLRGFGYGYAFYFAAVLLSACGAYAGLLPAQAYRDWAFRRAEGLGLSHHQSAYWTWLAGFIDWAALLLGAMLPPALLAACVHLFQAVVRCCRGARQRPEPSTLARPLLGAGGPAPGACQAEQESWTSCAGSATDLRDFSPLDVDALTQQTPAQRAAHTARYVTRGRPDLAHQLADIRAAHRDALEVVVYTSGPRAMCRSVRDACQASRGAPYPDCHILSFAM